MERFTAVIMFPPDQRKNTNDRVKATWRTIWQILSWRTNFFTWRTRTVGELPLAVGEHTKEFREPMISMQDLSGRNS